MNGQPKPHAATALALAGDKPTYRAQHPLPEDPLPNPMPGAGTAAEQSDLGRLLLDHTGELACLLDQAGHFVYVNSAAEDCLGYPAQSLVGQLAFNLVHPDDFALVMRRWTGLERHRQGRVLCRVRHADGSWPWLELRASLIVWRGLPAALVLGNDVSERMQLEEHIAHMQKVDSLGHVAGSIAHDFNNMLTAILGYAEMGIRDLEEGTSLTSLPDLLVEIQKAATRAAGLTRQVLEFSRRQTVAPRVLQLNRVLRDLETLLRSLAGHNIDLGVQMEERLGLIRGDAGQIEQVVVNLVINARDAMPSGGRLLIETSNVQLDQPPAQLLPGSYVLLSIRDTGSGMDVGVLERVFEPFFTTKAPGRGTGMGLATCHSIIKQHGGAITIASAPGQGTTVQVYLPHIGAVVVPEDIETAPADLPRGSERLLLVEDEAVVRGLAAQLLGSLGYSVRVAASGSEALDQIARAPVDLLIVDVMIPEIDGVSLALQASAHMPQLKVLLMSGYHASVVQQQGYQSDRYHFLQKPFSPMALAQAVRRALTDAPALQAHAV